MFQHDAKIAKQLRVAMSGIALDLLCPCLAIVLLVGLASPAAAATLRWDGDGAAPLGGSGTWNVTDLNWVDEDGAYHIWDDSGNHEGVFDTTGGKVTLSSTVIAQNLSFKVSGYSIAGTSPIHLVGASPSIAVAADVLATIAAPMVGNTGLRKTGNGTLALSAVNSYSGPTVIAGGVLHVSGASALPGGVGVTGGTSNVNLAGGVLQVDNVGKFTRGLGEGPSQIQFAGSGGFAAYGKTVAVDLGGASVPLVWGQAFFVPQDSSLLLGSHSANATVDFQNPIDFGSALRVVDVRKGDVAVDATLSGVLSGTAGFEKVGPGTLELTGANTYSGPTVVSGGILRLNSANALPGGIAALGGASNLVLAGGMVELGNGNFYRGLGTDPGQVQFTASGGFTGPLGVKVGSHFYLGAETRIVNLGGQSAPVVWGSGGFVPDGASFLLGATGASGSLDFQNPIYLGDLARTIHVDGVSSWNSIPPFGHVVLSGGITGSGALIKSGSGTLKLTTANTYGGPTQVTGGMLQLAHPQALPGGIASSGGTSHLSLSGGARLLLDSGDFQRGLGAGPAEVSFAGTSGFAGGMNHTVNFGGAGAPILWDGNPHFPDDLTFVLENAGSGGPMDLQNPLVLGPGKRTIHTSVGNGSVHGRLSATVSGPGGLKKTGALVLELTAPNFYEGQTEVTDGVLRLSHPDALPGGIGVSGGASNLNFTGTGSGWSRWSSGSFSGGSGAIGPVVELAVGDFTRTLGTGPDQVQFTGSGGFSAFGADRVVNLGGDTVQVVWDQSSFVPTGSALRLSSDYSNATIDFQNPIHLGDSARTVDVVNGAARVDAILSGALSGAGGLTKTGAGTLELTTANDYSGETRVSQGVLRLSHPQALPGGTGVAGGTSNLVLNSGVIELACGDFFRGVGTAPNQVQLSGGGFAAKGGDRIVNLGGQSATVSNAPPTSTKLILGSTNADGTLDFQNPMYFEFSQTIQVEDGAAAVDARLSGTLSGARSLSKTNAGTLELTAANGYTGETILNGGVLRLSHPEALPGGCGATGGIGNLRISGGVVELAAGDFFRGIGTGAGQVRWGTGGGGFAAVGADRVVNLGGQSAPITWSASYFAPSPFILGSPHADATIDFQNPLNLSGLPTFRVDDGTAIVDAKLSGVLSGTSQLTITGNGTLELAANNTLTGTTRLEGGRLWVTGSLTSSPITVRNGATLGGNGSVGRVTVSAGGHLAPGTSIGVLTLTDNLTLAAGAWLEFDLATPSASDLIAMPQSTLSLNGQQFADFVFSPQPGYGPGVYTLIDAREIFGNLGTDREGVVGGYSAVLSTTGGKLTLTVVPEPSTLVLLGALVVALLSYVSTTRSRREASGAASDGRRGAGPRY
jgi:autotransporter-associated beta strand protein